MSSLPCFALVDKPPGMTSFDLVRLAKRHLNRSDVGHGGTLDSFATGALPLFWGEGLKVSRFFTESFPALSVYWKSYVATLTWGIATTTGCPDGDPLPLSTQNWWASMSKEQWELALHQVLPAFQNFTYNQTPPIYSAKKIQGQRASDLARSGASVSLKPVPVTIKTMECLSLDWETRQIAFRVTCSKGTYVRQWGQDFMEALARVLHEKPAARSPEEALSPSNPSLPSHLLNLRRVAVGPFAVAESSPWTSSTVHKQDDPDFSRTEFLESLLEKTMPLLPLSNDETTWVVTGQQNRFWREIGERVHPLRHPLYPQPLALTYQQTGVGISLLKPAAQTEGETRSDELLRVFALRP